MIIRSVHAWSFMHTLHGHKCASSIEWFVDVKRILFLRCKFALQRDSSKGQTPKANANIQKDSNCQTTITVLLLPPRLRHVFYLRWIHLAFVSYRHSCECGAMNNHASCDSCSWNAFKQLHAANDYHSLAIADLATPCLLHIHFALVS